MNRQYTIRKRLILGYSILICILLLTMGGAVIISFSRYSYRTSMESIETRMEDISRSVRDELFSVVSLCDQIKEDSRIGSILNNPDITGDDLLYLQQIHSEIIPNEYAVARLILISRDLKILDPVYSRKVYSDAILNHPDFIDFLTGGNTYHFSRAGTFPIDLSPDVSDSPTVVLYQRMMDDNYWLQGYLLAILRKEQLFLSLNQNNEDDFFSELSIVNSKFEPVFSQGTEEILSAAEAWAKETEKKTRVQKINGEKHFVLYQSIPLINWHMAGAVPLSHIMIERNGMIRILGAVAFLFLAIAVMISYLLARTITKPLFELISAMDRYQKDQTLKTISLDAGGELGTLISVYNRLVSDINRYIRDIHEEHEHTKEAELKSLQYELNFLQAQINPHFVHNTLNALGYLAEKQGSQELFDSLKALNRLLHGVLSRIDAFVSLEEEISLIEDYMVILKLRYGSHYSLFWEVPSSCLSYDIPCMILQPLVENAVFHGLVPKKEGDRHITITAEERDELFLLTIEDNGVGFDRGDTKEMTKGFNRIGLANVDERIRILYGEEYGLEVDRSVQKGSRIILRFPSLNQQYREEESEWL